MNVLTVFGAQRDEGYLFLSGPSRVSSIHTLKPKAVLFESGKTIVYPVKIDVNDRGFTINFNSKEKMNDFIKMYQRHLTEGKNLTIRTTEELVIQPDNDSPTAELLRLLLCKEPHHSDASKVKKEWLDFFASAEIE